MLTDRQFIIEWQTYLSQSLHSGHLLTLNCVDGEGVGEPFTPVSGIKSNASNSQIIDNKWMLVWYEI